MKPVVVFISADKVLLARNDGWVFNYDNEECVPLNLSGDVNNFDPFIEVLGEKVMFLRPVRYIEPRMIIRGSASAHEINLNDLTQINPETDKIHIVKQMDSTENKPQFNWAQEISECQEIYENALREFLQAFSGGPYGLSSEQIEQRSHRIKQKTTELDNAFVSYLEKIRDYYLYLGRDGDSEQLAHAGRLQKSIDIFKQ